MKSLFPILLLILTACGDRTDNVPDPVVEQEEADHTHSLDLRPHDVPFMVELDQNLLATDTPQVRWNEEFGKLEVTAGERFRITIAEEPGDIERLKADLERDMLRKHTVIEEGNGLVIYRSEFPDDQIVFVHFYRVIEHDGRSFVIESQDQGRFNEADIRIMARAVRPAQEA